MEELYKKLNKMFKNEDDIQPILRDDGVIDFWEFDPSYFCDVVIFKSDNFFLTLDGTDFSFKNEKYLIKFIKIIKDGLLK